MRRHHSRRSISCNDSDRADVNKNDHKNIVAQHKIYQFHHPDMIGPSSVTSWSNFVHAREIYENLFARRQLVKTPNLKHKRLIYELTEKPE